MQKRLLASPATRATFIEEGADVTQAITSTRLVKSADTHSAAVPPNHPEVDAGEKVSVPEERPSENRPKRGLLNNIRHGEKSANLRLVLSEAPSKYIRQTRQARHFRAALEHAVIEQHKVIDLPRAALIEGASVAYLRSLMVDAFMRSNEGKLSVDQWLAYADRSIRFRQARDKAVADLRINPSDLQERSALDAMGIAR